MTSRNIAIFSLTMLVLVAVAAHAQGVRATVPFEFIVDNETFPAGEYTVTLTPFQGRQMALLSGPDGKGLRFLSTLPCEPAAKDGNAYLLFRGYGNRQFLAQIWTGSSSVGRELSMSKAEREVVKRAKGSEPQKLLVAAK